MQFSARDVVLTALFAALAVVAAVMINIIGPIVPFSLVPFVVLLAGILLGPRLAALSMLVYALLGLIGLPVFERPPFGGPGYVLQPTFGFILGYIAAAYVTGILAGQGQKKAFFRYFAASVAGVAVLYLCGLPYLYVVLNYYMGKGFSAWQVIQIGFIPFIIWDIIKAAAAAGLAGAVLQRLPGFKQRPGSVK